ncbi:Crotonobetainyl-CoA:carnitine CoA-transferase CaiB [Dethiosulfatibacter aminovorans DSM 17477]|uniref:Crotonobetainyl-CoA:carnitine CoA-transferase CaiB n=1 Tax=Dethiosulfatibacter aminovorans DSM 17477 TaxID=1121476 RepID=A0A1M6AUV6_9FIRM|nr:CoA transferase [Dethiosulfatibacter aminovorans]SHI40329.1 Crotonobetainyl-CoA:carnitine CoA-transferase CaiB [Dethiosulfatibacter aminovorans DSM 17477]
MYKPLKGVKVVDLTYFIAGPGTARILADWGADVIKVEPFWGDPGRTTGAGMGAPADFGANPLYSCYNSEKRGISIDLKSEKGMEILHKLLETADVFVSSYRTKALNKLGLDYETVHEKYPKIVWAQINGYGDEGPAKDNPGFDVIAFWARSGAMSDAAEIGTAVNPPIGFGDATTSCSLAGGIAAALYEQQRTGVGAKVMVSLFTQAIWNLSSLVASVQYGDKYPKTRTMANSPVINSYECKDGKWIFLAILEHERYFDSFCKVIEREDLIGNEKFCTGAGAKENSPELIEIISDAFKNWSQDEMHDKLIAVDIAHERIQGVEDVLNDPQALANNYIHEVENRDGTRSFMAMPPIKFNNVNVNVKSDAPLIGEHNEEILMSLGYTMDEIKEMEEANFIKSVAYEREFV